MNTDTYQNALESTKDSIEDVNNAIGFSLGSLTLEKLITSAVTLVICVLVKFTSGPDFPAELDRVLGITDGILRSLITRRPE